MFSRIVLSFSGQNYHWYWLLRSRLKSAPHDSLLNVEKESAYIVLRVAVKRKTRILTSMFCRTRRVSICDGVTKRNL